MAISPHRPRLHGLNRALALLLLAGFLTGSAEAEVGPASLEPLPAEITLEGQPLIRNGRATRTVWGFWVYQIGLYLKSPSADENYITQTDRTPKSVRIFMERAVGKETFSGTVQESINRNFTLNEQARFAKELETFLACFQDGEDLTKGSLVTIDFLPGRGMAVAVDNKRLAVIPGDTFYHMILRLWIGRPIQASIKTGLLGQ